MSTKHYFPEDSVNTLVPRYLKSLVYANPNLGHNEPERVIFSKSHDPAQVSVISGGGSGHEPSWSGYVGNGLLSAVACGDIFASPSMKQVLAAIVSVPSEQGTILMITNYTGDRLHFGLAAERALASGLSKKVVVLPATDDVSIGKSKASIVGRRGMPGHMITMKIVGAAASKGLPFDRIVTMGKALNTQLVSIGSALDHCHVPGRQNHEHIPDDICVVGAGIHNEPGAKKISPFPSVENLIAELLALLCDPNDPERAFVKFNENDHIVLLINNYGGMAELEIGALIDEILIQLESTWCIKPVKVYSGVFESSLNGPGFSISLCNLTVASEECNFTPLEFLDLLNAPTSAIAWPNTSKINANIARTPSTPSAEIATRPQIPDSEDIKIEPKLLEKIVKGGCDRAIAAEPNLTKWDMVMGDGDCGEAVEGVSKAVLKDSPITTKKGSLFELLYSTIDKVDDMGGTLGAIFGIFLSALATSLRGASSIEQPDYASAVAAATTALKQYTGAREGDRTVMDVLLPFADSFEKTRDFKKAVEVAKERAEATRYLKPKFGRASYVGAGGKEQELPDPGAWALFELLQGMLDGMN